MNGKGNNGLSEETLIKLREKYPKGCRIVLDVMDDPYESIPAGTQGTVAGVDDIGSIMVRWDTGSSLSVQYDVDRCHRIATEEEILTTLNWYGKHQKAKDAICPRCGNPMPGSTLRYALSRYAWIMVCSRCGMEEALEQFGLTNMIELREWAAIKFPFDRGGAWEIDNSRC